MGVDPWVHAHLYMFTASTPNGILGFFDSHPTMGYTTPTRIQTIFSFAPYRREKWKDLSRTASTTSATTESASVRYERRDHVLIPS